MPGVVVTWSVASGGGSVDPPQVGTDSSGLALATHTFGPVAMSQSVTASVPGLPMLTFNAAVTVGNNFFDPSDVIVQIGSTVAWTWNSAGVSHNVTYMGDPMLLPQGSTTQAGGMHSNTYGTAAEYRYFCSIHGGMEGTVTVVR
jgi:plastocyanin